MEKTYEQLKEENKLLSKALSECKLNAHHAELAIEKLEKENEKLKVEINQLESDNLRLIRGYGLKI